MSKVRIENEVKEILLREIYEAQQKRESNLQAMLNDPDFDFNYSRRRQLILDVSKLEFAKKDASSKQKELKECEQTLTSILNKNNMNWQDIDTSAEKTSAFELKKHPRYKAVLSEVLMQNSGLSSKTLKSFNDVNFEVFDKKVKATVEKLYAVMKQYSEDLNASDKKTITLSGNTGVGKTFLAECIISNVVSKGGLAVYATSGLFISDMLKYHLASLQEKPGIMDKYITSDLLLLDDLGSEPYYNNVSEEYLFFVLNERISKGKNTIITTNLDISQIREVYGERIFSRLVGRDNSLLLKLDGDDLRIKKSA